MPDLCHYKMMHSGFFSEVNNAVGAARFAEDRGLLFRPRWVSSRYGKSNQDAWPIYFSYPRPEGVVKATVGKDEPKMRPYRACIAPRYPEQPEAFVRRYGCRVFLREPADRHAAHDTLERYFQWSSCVNDALAEQHELIDQGPSLIGVHCRGPQRLHGGAGYLADALGLGRPPYTAYFQAIERQIGRSDVILLCTDAMCVADIFGSRYGDRLVVSSWYLPDSGEPHLVGAADSWQLGLDVITDAELLSHCRYFIHGNSNLSNYVLCRAPDMPHEDIYHSVYPDG